MNTYHIYINNLLIILHLYGVKMFSFRSYRGKLNEMGNNTHPLQDLSRIEV